MREGSRRSNFFGPKSVPQARLFFASLEEHFSCPEELEQR
jgi:hypothetical protein